MVIFATESILFLYKPNILLNEKKARNIFVSLFCYSVICYVALGVIQISNEILNGHLNGNNQKAFSRLGKFGRLKNEIKLSLLLSLFIYFQK